MPPLSPQDFQLPTSANAVIPQELGQDFFSSLDQLLQLQEKKQTENLLGAQESRGLLQSGDTNKRLVEDILGPGLERRKQALLPFAFQSAAKGQEQRFQTDFEKMQFQQQQEFQKQNFLNQLRLMQEQLYMQEQLGYFQTQLGPSAPSFGTQLAQGLGRGLTGGLEKGAQGGLQGLFTAGQASLFGL